MQIRIAHKKSRETYGSPRITRELKETGIPCSENRVARLMREEGIRAKMVKKFKVTTRSNHSYRVFPNLLDQNFDVTAPNRVWVADITYIPTEEGWLYLCAIEDLFSRQIVGFAIRPHLSAELATEALWMACLRRRPPRGVIFHTDRGSQFASRTFQKQLSKRGFIPSMSRKGNCYDNAVIESFFHTLKTEEVNLSHYATRRQALVAIADYIAFYNRIRRHSYLQYLSPMNFEMARSA